MALLPGAILFGGAIRGNIVESSVEEFRRGIQHRINPGVGINQDKIGGFHVLGIKLTDKIPSFSPQGESAMRIVQGYIVQVFKVSCVDQFPVG